MFKQLLEAHFDEIARITTLENGKTLTESKAELRRGIENVEVACGIPTLMQGYNLEDVSGGIDELMIRQPLGVVAAITPFNFPAMIPLWFLPYGDRLRKYIHFETVGTRAAHRAQAFSSCCTRPVSRAA